MKTQNQTNIFDGLPTWPARTARPHSGATTMDWGAPALPPCAPTEPALPRIAAFLPAVPAVVAATVRSQVQRFSQTATPAIATPQPRLVDWLLAGGVSGLMVGWLDGYWAATRAGLEPMTVGGYRTTILLAVLLSIVFASLTALISWPVAAAVYKRDMPARAGRALVSAWQRWRGRIALAAGATIGLFLVWTEMIGFQWAAIDPRLPALVVIEFAVFLTVRRGVRGWNEGGVGTALFGLAGVVVILLAGYAALEPGRSEALTRLGGEAVVNNSFLGGSRALLDGDGDGHPSGLCVEDCDCDDNDATVHPGARDIVGNGVDEDCDGRDASRAHAAEYRAILNPAGAPAAGDDAPINVRRVAPANAVAGSDGVLNIQDDGEVLSDTPPNIVFIVIDTLRADHLGTYGYKRPVSPNLDRLGERGVVFDQARATGSQTRFSVPPMLTGKYFTEIERTTGLWPTVRKRETLIAERLQKRGYQTSAVHSITYFKKWSGMDQGMDAHDTSCAKGRTARTSKCVTDRALSWLDGRDEDRPFFLWAYYGDPHAPYLRHKETPSYGSRPKDVYDQEVQFTDMNVGRLIDGMRERGLDLSNTLFVVTSDHGEGLDEREDHGHRFHGATLTDEVLRVPLIVAGPGLEQGRVQTPVSLLDIAPTLVSMSGGQPVKSYRGVSLLPWLTGDDAPRGPVFFEKHKEDALPQKGMVMWPYKVILVLPYHRLRIYNLAKDPGEKVDIKKTLPPEEVRRLVGTLKYWMNESLRPATPIAPAARP